ncbi:uncharacterized protein LOC129796913 [Lutzomyia longipalpis]|uniref:uncharacterized protein LOC129796913 n=1 Tax=Lutzomyia longipalpis TaxID=7200 RepID=UPI00248466FB|nr:uncharacterized protein LOC129796913 [Lutzomyia longipalpis]
MKKIITKATNITPAFRPIERVGQFFTKLKDPIPPDKRSNVVYRIPCGACEGVYVGTTGRMLRTRVREHYRDCKVPIRREKAAASALCEHSHDTGHVFKFEEAQILDTHQHYSKRLMLEALHIKCNIEKAFIDATLLPELCIDAPEDWEVIPRYRPLKKAPSGAESSGKILCFFG